MNNAYRSESTGFIEKGNRRKKILNQRWRERKAREFVNNLNKHELAELRQAITELDEGIAPSSSAEELKERSGLEIWEALQRRGRRWLDRVRGKQDER